ncbi:MAG TPA: EAL domain-containing protein [Acidimicrobiales bacterium]|nr:EAL domain-containing protein [Acidimicrobiales bacterium]
MRALQAADVPLERNGRPRVAHVLSLSGVRRYVHAVTAVGSAVLVLGAWRGFSQPVSPHLGPLLVFAAFVLLGDLRPIRIPRRDEQEEIVTSATFTFAILLTAGLGPALVVRTLAALVPALLRRKPWWKSFFNVSQYALSLSASALALQLLVDVPRTTTTAFLPADLLGILAAGVVYFVVNNAVTGVALALAQETPVLEYLRHDLLFQATIAAILLGLAPVVVVSAEFSLVLVPLFALPMVAVYSSASVSMERHQALHDALTNLPNRRLFRDRVHQAVINGKRTDVPAAVMILDLDRFKDVNDTLGHHIGDLLLQQVGARLQSTLREGDTIARLGGDEFAILLPTVAGEAAAAQVARKIVSVLEEPFVLKGWNFDIEASIGIALFPEHGHTVDTLMQRADVAMYVAKESRGGYEVYHADRDRHSPRRLALLGELRRGIEEGNLVVHYQPKADMRTGGIRGVEALVRWEHAEHGLVPPDEFIPLAEHTGLIRTLTLWVLDQSLAQCRAWQDDGLRLGVAVNLSVRNLYDPSFADEVAELLDKWGIESRMLELEITESVIMADPLRAMTVLARLSSLGVGLSLDDFGVGYSSLAYLKRLPVTEIKIDKSFVMNITSDESDALIVRSTIGLARSLGLRVVAEGVETEEAWARLVALGCDVAQGYYLCKPKPADELASWLASVPIAAEPSSPDPVGTLPSVEEVCLRLGEAQGARG